VKFFVKTFGCKVNQFESEYFINSLLEKGLDFTNSEKDSDIFVVNSCAVTNEAERQLKQYLRKLRRSYPHKKIILTGCAVDANKDFEKNLFDVIISNYNKKKLPDIIFQNNQNIWIESVFNEKKFVKLEAEHTFQHTRKFFKIQDGCSNYCSYCIIPYVRGLPRSLQLNNVIDSLINISRNYREVVLTGINIEDYGKDLNLKNGFIKLVEKIENELDKKNIKNFRIRVTSLKPDEVLYNYIDIVSNSKYFSPHFHLSVQNLNNKILKLMNRKYSSEYVFQIVEEIKEKIPYAGIGADIITGFIGEEKEEFEDNLKKIEKINIDFFHIFPFSKKDKTKAGSLQETSSKREKKGRVKILKQITDNKKEKFVKKNLNRFLNVLIEKEDSTYFSGYSENYIKVLIPKKKYFTLKNKFVNVYGEKIKDRYFIEAEIAKHLSNTVNNEK
jgi:threonylcarbamoyladenosine tRNA methylthiotransferase MtaB